MTTAGHPHLPVLLTAPPAGWPAEPTTSPIPITDTPTRPIPVIDEKLLAGWFGVDRDAEARTPQQQHARQAAVLAVLVGCLLLAGLLVAAGLG